MAQRAAKKPTGTKTAAWAKPPYLKLPRQSDRRTTRITARLNHSAVAAKGITMQKQGKTVKNEGEMARVTSALVPSQRLTPWRNESKRGIEKLTG